MRRSCQSLCHSLIYIIIIYAITPFKRYDCIPYWVDNQHNKSNTINQHNQTCIHIWMEFILMHTLLFKHRHKTWLEWAFTKRFRPKIRGLMALSCKAVGLSNPKAYTPLSKSSLRSRRSKEVMRSSQFESASKPSSPESNQWGSNTSEEAFVFFRGSNSSEEIFVFVFVSALFRETSDN